jgi:general secretion pathway protein M
MLTTREKVLVVSGIGFTVIMLLWGMVYEPMKNKQSKLSTDIKARTSELRWMHVSSQKIKYAKNQPKKTKPIAKGTPSSIINNNLRRFGLQKDSKMSGRKKIDLRLRNVQTDSLMKFLGNLEMQYGIYVLSMDITPKNATGSTDANIKLGRI